MKSKKMALFVSTIMTANILIPSLAHAEQNGPKIDDTLIDQSITSQSAEMRRTLKQIDALIGSMEQYKRASGDEKQNAFVNTARLMITLLGLGSTALHAKNAQAESSIELTLAAVSGILSTVLEQYVSHQRIDMNKVAQLLSSEQNDLTRSLSGASREDAIMISGAISQIAEINSQLDSKAGDIKRQIDNGQTDLAIVSIVTLVLHYAAPYLPAKLREAVSEKAPNVVSKLATTKKRSMQGLGATNIATLLATIAGLSGPSAQAQINRILANLYQAKANLMKQIGSN